MTVRSHGRWFLLSINFAFVSWGVLFLIGVTHGIFRREVQGSVWLKIIFVAVTLSHLAALLCLASAVYNGAAYILRRLSANRRALKRIETLRGKKSSGGKELDASEVAAIYEEEYTTNQSKRPGRPKLFSGGRWQRSMKLGK